MSCYVCYTREGDHVCGCSDMPICRPCQARVLAEVKAFEAGTCPQCRQAFTNVAPARVVCRARTITCSTSCPLWMTAAVMYMWLFTTYPILYLWLAFFLVTVCACSRLVRRLDRCVHLEWDEEEVRLRTRPRIFAVQSTAG